MPSPPIAAHERPDLLELLDDRVGSRATLITSQLPVTAWHTWLDEPTLADAILDRIVHGSHKIALKGESMRKLAKAACGRAQTCHSMAIADISDRIGAVTQDTCAGCPPSYGMLSAMNVESVSPISGMRTLHKSPACVLPVSLD